MAELAKFKLMSTTNSGGGGVGLAPAKLRPQRQSDPAIQIDTLQLGGTSRQQSLEDGWAGGRCSGRGWRATVEHGRAGIGWLNNCRPTQPVYGATRFPAPKKVHKTQARLHRPLLNPARLGLSFFEQCHIYGAVCASEGTRSRGLSSYCSRLVASTGHAVFYVSGKMLH